MPGKPPIYPADRPQGPRTAGTGRGSLGHIVPPCRVVCVSSRPPPSDDGTQLCTSASSLCASVSLAGAWEGQALPAGTQGTRGHRCPQVGSQGELCHPRGGREGEGDGGGGGGGAPTLARLAVKSTHSKSSPMRCRNSSTCGRLSTYTCGHGAEGSAPQAPATRCIPPPQHPHAHPGGQPCPGAQPAAPCWVREAEGCLCPAPWGLPGVGWGDATALLARPGRSVWPAPEPSNREQADCPDHSLSWIT